MTQRLPLSLAVVVLGFSLHAVGAVQLSCDDNSGVLIGYSTDSIVVQVPVNGTYDIVPIHGCTGPPLCQEDPTLCRPLIIGGKSLVISAVGSLVFFNLATPSQDPYVVSITRSCTPTNLVLVTDDEEDTSYLWVACISDSLPSLMYLSYSLSFSGDGEVISASFINQLPEVSLSESSTSFSESILLPDLCSTSGNFRLYVVHDDFIWYFPVSPGVVREFVRSDVQLENCSSVSYIEHSDASEGITIHCSSSGVVVSYSTCSEDAQYHSLAVDGIPYSCGTGSVRYRTDSIEVLGADDDDSTSLRQFDHTLGIITYGRCYGDFFTVITASGSLYIVQLAGTASGEVTKLADVCDDTSCVSPAFGSTGLLVYDVSDSALFPVSVLDACASPVVGTPYSIQRPSYVSISSTGSSTCDCTTVPVPMTTGTPTESENPPKMDENKDEKKIVALSVVIPLVCIIVAVIGVAIILYKCANRMNRRRLVSLTTMPMAQCNGGLVKGDNGPRDSPPNAPTTVEGDGGSSTKMVSYNVSLTPNTEFTPEQVVENSAKKQDTDDKINDWEVKRRLMD